MAKLFSFLFISILQGGTPAPPQSCAQRGGRRISYVGDANETPRIWRCQRFLNIRRAGKLHGEGSTEERGRGNHKSLVVLMNQ